MKGWLTRDLQNPFSLWRRARAEADFHNWAAEIRRSRMLPDELRDACQSLSESLGEAAERTDELFR